MHSSDKRLHKLVLVTPQEGGPSMRMTLGEALASGIRTQKAGDLRAAESVFRELCRLMPKAEQARGLLAETLLAQQLPVRAQKVITPLLGKARDPGTLLVGARIARRLRRFEEGRALVERAIRLDRARVDLLFELASWEMELGRRDAAAEILGRVIGRAPRLAAAYWQRAQLDLVEHDAEHLAEMEGILAAGTFPPHDRAFLHFACARIHARRGDIDTEFRHLEQGNGIVALQRPWDPEIDQRRFAAIRGFLEAGMREGRVRTEVRHDLAPILIASMPRSGSTLVERIVGAHPGVTSIGECGLFASAAAERLRELGEQDLGDLWSGRHSLDEQLEALAGHIATFIDALGVHTPRFVEKGISNFEYLPFLLLAFPRAQAIHVLRNPLDAALSAYQLHFSEGHGYAYELKAFAIRYKQHLALMDSWRELFPGRIATLHYEDLVRCPAENVRSLLDFCALPWDERCLRFHESRGAVQTASFLQVRRPLHPSSVGRYRRYESHLSPVAVELNLDLPR